MKNRSKVTELNIKRKNKRGNSTVEKFRKSDNGLCMKTKGRKQNYILDFI